MKDISPNNINIVPMKEKVVVATSGTQLADKISGWTINSNELSVGKIHLQSANERILIGDATLPLTGIGIFMGLDGSDYEWRVGNPAGDYIHWDGTIMTIRGALTASSINIPDTVTANSFHTDTSGNSWWGSTVIGSALAKILNTGAGTFSNITIDGGSNVKFISDTLDTSAKKILSDFTFGSTDYSGAFKTGDITWNPATGVITGGSGGLFNKNGLIFASGGVATITLDGVTGSASFAGSITGGTITIGTNAWHVDSSGNMWWGNYATYALASNKVSTTGEAYFNQLSTAAAGSRTQINGADISLYDASSNVLVYFRGSTGEGKVQWLRLPEHAAPTVEVNEGCIYVKSDNLPYYKSEGGVEQSIMLGTLSGVADKNIFSYNAATSLWKNQTASTLGLLEKSGGTMTGDLVLHADPTVDLEASTKQYVDNISKESVIYRDLTTSEHTGDTGWYTVKSYTLPANTLGSISGLRITATTGPNTGTSGMRYALTFGSDTNYLIDLTITGLGMLGVFESTVFNLTTASQNFISKAYTVSTAGSISMAYLNHSGYYVDTTATVLIKLRVKNASDTETSRCSNFIIELLK